MLDIIKNELTKLGWKEQTHLRGVIFEFPLSFDFGNQYAYCTVDVYHNGVTALHSTYCSEGLNFGAYSYIGADCLDIEQEIAEFHGNTMKAIAQTLPAKFSKKRNSLATSGHIQTQPNSAQ